MPRRYVRDARGLGGSASPETMTEKSPQAQISGGIAAVSNALRITRSTCLPILGDLVNQGELDGVDF